MANELSKYDIIGGIGAALSGRAGQYMQDLQLSQQQREKALYQDAVAALSMAENENYQGVIDLTEDRIDILNRMGIPYNETLAVQVTAQRALQGDQEAISTLKGGLGETVEKGYNLGILQRPVEEEYTLGQGDTRFRGREEIARGQPKETERMLSKPEVQRLISMGYPLNENNPYSMKGGDLRNPGEIRSINSGQTINIGNQTNDLRAGLYKSFVDAIPDGMSNANAQIGLAEEVQMIADMFNRADASMFQKYMMANHPDLAQMTLDETGILTSAQAIANRLAPQMRETGSGSTSDMEMGQYMRSLPTLMQSNSGRSITAAVFQKKADIERARLELFNKFVNEEIDEIELSRGIIELNSRSLFDQDLKTEINALAPGTFRNESAMELIGKPGSGING